MKVIQSFTLSSRLAFSSKQVSCLRFPSVGRKVWTTTLSSFFDFRKFIWVNMINSKSLRYYNVKIKKKKTYLVFQKVLIVKAYKFYTGKLLEFECLNFRHFFPPYRGKTLKPTLLPLPYHCIWAVGVLAGGRTVTEDCVCHPAITSPTEHGDTVFSFKCFHYNSIGHDLS